MEQQANAATQADAWDEAPKQDFTVDELDGLVHEEQRLKADYKAKKEISTAAYNLHKEHQARMITIFEAAGKKKYPVDGLGTSSVVSEEVYSLPRGALNKKAMLVAVAERETEDYYYDFVTVNSKKFNSYCKSKSEEAKDEGKLFELPGVGEPTINKHIRFTPERKKAT